MRWTLKRANNEVEQYGFKIDSYQGRYKVIKIDEQYFSRDGYYRGDSIKECLAWIKGFTDALGTVKCHYTNNLPEQADCHIYPNEPPQKGSE